MRRFRCVKCNFPHGYEFASDVPGCPSCRKFGLPFVYELTDVHWLGPMHRGPIVSVEQERLAIACVPGRQNVYGISATPELVAVTCPKCRATPQFIAAWNLWAEMYPEQLRAWEVTQSLGRVLTT